MKYWFQEQDMYDHVYDMIRTRHPAADGWIIRFQDNRFIKIRPDFTAERKQGLRTERAVVEVKRNTIVTENDVRQLSNYVRVLSGGSSFVPYKYLVVPSGTDIEQVRTRLAATNIILLRTRFYQHFK